VSLYLARLLLGFTSIGLVFLAIKLIPYKKYLLVAIGLIPMLLFQQSVVTVDGVSYALLALFISYILYLREASVITRKRWLILGLMSVGIVLAKPLIFLFLPFILLLAKRRNVSWICLIAVASIVTLVGWTMLTSVRAGAMPSVSTVPDGVNGQEQLKGLVENPKRGLRVAWNTYMTPYGDDQARGVIGVFGAADTYYPLWMSASYAILLGMLFFINIDVKRSKRIEKKWIILVIILCIAYFAAVNLAIYMSYTPVNFDIVYGVQGRYFLPIVIVVAMFLSFGGVRIQKTDIKKFQYGAIVAMVLLVALALLITYQRYYLYTP
jgi:uncharacterized membrane protein